MTTATVSATKAKVKFRLAGGAQPLIILPTRVNGAGPFDFILDTGAGTSLLSAELAQQLNVKVLGTKEGQSAGGKISVSLAKVDSLAVGQAKIDEVEVGIVDLSHITKAIGTKVDGDVGYNFLKHFRVTIDYQTGEIRFDDPKRIENFRRPSKTEIAMRLASPAKPLLLLDVHANGRGPFQFAIDTGTSTTAIAPEVARQLEIEGSPMGPLSTGAAQVQVTAGRLKSFQVGDARVDDLVVVVADFFAMLSQAVGAKLDGIVGYNFLRNFRVVIDYPNEKFRLE
jgi:predicted aspartyl protease